MTQTNSHFSSLPERLQHLGDLAYNLWFSWHSRAVRLFQSLDQKLWEDVSHNPVRLLRELDNQRLDEMSENPKFLSQYDAVIQAFDHYMKRQDTWYNTHYSNKKDERIAYFSMEFGLHESLPIYSGGLGILAGDHLKSASDLGLPLVAVGLLYREAYFTQFISMHGNQQSMYLYNDFSDMPLLPVLEENEEPVYIEVMIEDRPIALRVWVAQIGRIPLFLLDSDYPDNRSDDRDLLKRLYVGDRDSRLIQEILLGVGGVRVLRRLGYNPTVWHMNEGHCSFTSLERIRELLPDHSWEDALTKIKSSTLFTTHTPIPAGNEVFGNDRVAHFLKPLQEEMGVPSEAIHRLARNGSIYDPNVFNMTILSLKTSDHANGVSQLHGHVARQMWHHLWPDRPLDEVPIGAITNGIHSRTWITTEIKNLFDEHLGEEWRYHLMKPDFWEKISDIPDERFWKTRQILRRRLRNDIRCRLSAQRERNGESRESMEEVKSYLNRNALTIGFARRFAPYKRGTLLFRNREWLKAILNKKGTPVQIIFAGKAHPENQPGKTLIKDIYTESRNPEFSGKIIFVENYDMAFARRLVSGVDIWLNTPRRPLEASGTSGMKAAANGALNLSILDGWWREAFDGKNGWAIGEDREYYNEWEQDEADSHSLYTLLETEIIPSFFKRNKQNLPAEWISRIKYSMKSIIPLFNTDRMVCNYMENYYIQCMQ
jgi:starch phosphorylase